MTPTPPPRGSGPRNPTHPPDKVKPGISSFAKFCWYVVAAPFALVGLSVLACVLIVVLSAVFTLPVLLMWNWGVVEVAPLFGVVLPTIGIAKAFAIALTTSLVRSFFSPLNPTRKNKPEPVTIIDKGGLK